MLRVITPPYGDLANMSTLAGVKYTHEPLAFFIETYNPLATMFFTNPISVVTNCVLAINNVYKNGF
jgi:hypothetical protein